MSEPTDAAKLQAKNRKVMAMEEGAGKLGAFPEFNARELLTEAGKVRADVAKALAESCYAEFDAKRKAADSVAADAVDLAELERLRKILGNAIATSKDSDA
jgi:hypothetical protein